jgi:hypothetical protein
MQEAKTVSRCDKKLAEVLVDSSVQEAKMARRHNAM